MTIEIRFPGNLSSTNAENFKSGLREQLAIQLQVDPSIITIELRESIVADVQAMIVLRSGFIIASATIAVDSASEAQQVETFLSAAVQDGTDISLVVDGQDYTAVELSLTTRSPIPSPTPSPTSSPTPSPTTPFPTHAPTASPALDVTCVNYRWDSAGMSLTVTSDSGGYGRKTPTKSDGYSRRALHTKLGAPKITNKKRSPKKTVSTGYMSNPRYLFTDAIAGCPLIDTSVYAGVTHHLAGGHGCGFNGKSFNCDFWNLTRACDGSAAGEPGSVAMIEVCDELCDLVNGCDGSMLDHSYDEYSGLCTLHTGVPMLSEACFFYSGAGGVTNEASCAAARSCDVCSRGSKTQLSELWFRFESNDGNSTTLSAPDAMASNGGVVADGDTIQFLSSRRKFRANFVVATASGEASPLRVSCKVPLMLNQQIGLPGAGSLVLVGFKTTADETELDLDCPGSGQSYSAGIPAEATGGKDVSKAQPGINTLPKGARRYGVEIRLPNATEGLFGHHEVICERNSRGKTHGKTSMGMGKKNGGAVGPPSKKGEYSGQKKKKGPKKGPNKGMGMGMGMGMGKGTDADADAFNSNPTGILAGISRNGVIGGVVIGVVVLFMCGVGLGCCVLRCSKAAKKRQLAVTKDHIQGLFALGAKSESDADQFRPGGAQATGNPPKDHAFEWDPVTASDPPAIPDESASPAHLRQPEATPTNEQLTSAELNTNLEKLRMTWNSDVASDSPDEAVRDVHDDDVVEWDPTAIFPSGAENETYLYSLPSETVADQFRPGGARATVTGNPPKDHDFEWDPVTASDPPAIPDESASPAHLRQLLARHFAQCPEATPTNEQLTSAELNTNLEKLRMTWNSDVASDSPDEAVRDDQDDDIVEWDPTAMWF